MRKRASVRFRLLETALARWISPLPADKLSDAAVIVRTDFAGGPGPGDDIFSQPCSFTQPREGNEEFLWMGYGVGIGWDTAQRN